MALNSISAMLCCPCRYCKRKVYSLFPKETPEDRAVQPISSREISEDYKPSPIQGLEKKQSDGDVLTQSLELQQISLHEDSHSPCPPEGGTNCDEVVSEATGHSPDSISLSENNIN